jgi:5-methylcytosine-specific restriction endonuclease McrA
MIPVTPQPEPANFDVKVRQPGQRWVARQGLDPGQPVPSGTQLKPYWTECLPQLTELYGRVCAYVCLYIPKITGSPSVEHFVPKSQQLGLAYEWSNYRLVCAKMNSRKRELERSC